MNKEQLEEINKRILDLKRKSGMPNEVLTFKGWESVVPVFTKDVEYLFEQAERMESLLEQTGHNFEVNRKLDVQNKQLKERAQELEKEYESLQRALEHHTSIAVDAHERVQELERANKIVNDVGVNIIKDLEKENVRLREVMEEIAGETFLGGDSKNTTEEKLIRVILKARQALEG